MHKNRIMVVGVVLILAVVSAAAAELPADRSEAVGPAPGDLSLLPIGTEGEWVDPMMEDDGFTWMHRVKLMSGDLSLSQMEPLGSAPQGGSILAMTQGPDGKIYLGTNGAYLSVYDPVTGVFTDLGAPVPDECFG